MDIKNIFDHLTLVAILGAIFLLITAILDATIGAPTLTDLLLHSALFQILLITCLWLIAFLILKYNSNDK
jgi:hypothetical protein